LWLLVFLGPATVLFAVFITYPILSSLAFSLYGWEGIARRGFVGLHNFARLFSTFPYSELLVNAFWHNVIVFAVTMLIQNVVALGLALLLARSVWGTRFYRVVFFLPVTLSLVIVGFLWALFLNPVFGIVNKLPTSAGLAILASPWLGDSQTALLTLTLINAWRWLGFPTIVFLAGINAVPDEYLDEGALLGGCRKTCRAGRLHDVMGEDGALGIEKVAEALFEPAGAGRRLAFGAPQPAAQFRRLGGGQMS